MPVFGVDMSNYDAGRGPEDIPAMYRDGIRFLTHKATEGTAGQHSNYGRILTAARDAGIPVLGAYHVVRSAPTAAAQVAYMLAYLDSATPWWRTHPNFMLQVDLELWPYDRVSAATGCAFADALRHATGKYVVVYASRGQYGNTIPPGCDLWNAAYPSSRSAHYSALYPGDGASGWNAYSGRTPVIWQYASTATVGSQPGCDANAFRGSLDQLLALTSGDDMSSKSDAILAAWASGVKVAADGTFVAPVDWEVRREANETAVNARLAAITATLAAQTQTIANLTGLLQQAGNPDVAPLVEQIKTMTAQLGRLADTEAAQSAQIASLQAKLAAAAKAEADTLGAS